MFLQICLVTAGLHYGRKLWEGWRDQQAELVDGSDRRDESETGQEAREGDALPASPTHPADGESTSSSPPGTASAEEAAVQEQFETAVVATGLTTAASFFPKLRLFGGVSAMYAGVPIFDKARHLIVDERRIGIEVLDSIGLIASIAARQYTFSAVMFLFYAAAQKLRLKTERELRESMLDVIDRQAEKVWTLQNGVEESVSRESLRAGDVVVVGAGTYIPADGVVTQGTALVDQRALIGEPALAGKAAGDEVFAMTLVSAGELHVQVGTTGKGNTAARISQVLQNITDFTSSIEVESKRRADASAAPILALSVLAYAVVGARGAIAMLGVGIADNLLSIAPLSMLNSLRKACDAGILIKDGRSLQLLTGVDTVVFDVGLLELTPPLRPYALEVIRSLKERNLSLYLLSGDHEAPTRAMAERMGVDRYYSGVLPLDKARIIDELQEQGKKVCFVGDGINDAIALRSATVSVSRSGASTVAMDSAQVMLMERGIGKLPELFTIAFDFQTNLRGILFTAVVPAATAAAGVFFAGFSTNVVAGLYVAGLASGMAVAMWPHRTRLLQSPPA